MLITHHPQWFGYETFIVVGKMLIIVHLICLKGIFQRIFYILNPVKIW